MLVLHVYLQSQMAGFESCLVIDGEPASYLRFRRLARAIVCITPASYTVHLLATFLLPAHHHNTIKSIIIIIIIIKVA